MMRETIFRRWLTILTIVVASTVIYAQNPVSIFQIGPSTVLTTTMPVSGTVTSNAGTNLNTSLLALEAGGNLAAIKAKTDNIPALGQALAAASVPIVLTAAQITTLTPPAAITGFSTETTLDTRSGSLTEAAPASDTASSGLNGRLQRIAQRLTSLIALLPSALVGGRLDVNVGAALPAGTNGIGKLTANSGVDIGDVDVTSLPGVGAIGAAPPASAVYNGGIGSGATGGLLVGVTVCDTPIPVSITTATTTLLVTGVSGRHIYICHLDLVTAIANNVAIITGTGATCGTSTAGVFGGTTAANGWNFAANGGIALGTGIGFVGRTETTGDSICAITSAAGPLAGALNVAIW